MLIRWVRSPQEQGNRDSLAAMYRRDRRKGPIGRLWARHCWKVKKKLSREIWNAYMGID
jgi:hypothetical protein